VDAGGETAAANTQLPVVMAWIWLNVPLCVAMALFTVGLPVWVMTKHPEGNSPVPLDRTVLRPEPQSVARPMADAGLL
jgi:hypothetical protein